MVFALNSSWKQVWGEVSTLPLALLLLLLLSHISPVRLCATP